MDFFDEIAEKIRKQTQGGVVNDTHEIDIQNRIKLDGQSIWLAVQSDIASQRKRINAALGQEAITFEQSPDENEVVLLYGLRRMVVSFYPQTGGLTWIKGVGSSGAFNLNIGSSGQLAFFSGGAEVGTGDIARTVLQALTD